MEEAKENRILIGRRIKELREKRGLLQEELANSVISKRSAISNYENGTSAPQPYMLSKIATVLNTTVDYLVGKTNNPICFDSDSKAQTIDLNGKNTHYTIEVDNKALSDEEIKLLITFIRTLRNSN